VSNTNLDLDTRLLSEFVYALNIARRQVAAYPPGHPMIAAAAEKLVSLQEKLLEFRRELTIGIARDTLLIDNKQLDPANPVYRDLAVHLFDAKVAFLTVQVGVTADDVRLLFEVLAYPGERIAAAGGLAALLVSSGVHGFKAREIDYRAFHATEVDSLHVPRTLVGNDESAVLWKAFASGMVSGTIDPNGVLELPQGQFDPVLLAEALNREQQAGTGRAAESYDHAIADFLKQSGSQQPNATSRQELFDRLGLLIEQLSPELRRRFLNSTLQGLSTTPDQATEMMANWSHSTIIEALEQINTEQLQVPRILLDILGKMGSQQGPAGGPRQGTPDMERNREQTAELLNRMFRDGAIESYVPKDYQDALTVLASADVATHLDAAQVDELLDDLNGHALERQFCSITLELMEQDVENRSVEAISRNLEEMVPYFLEAGDFQSLVGIHQHLCRLREVPQPSFSMAVHRSIDIFAGEGFVTQVLDGLDEWGKDQYPTIREMIGQIGVPFVDQLLDRLAEEPLMSRRRLYMECLLRIGAPASGFIVGRLHDPRWFVVRNLVVLLRELNDPETLRPLSRLFTHPHPKVQYEVMRTCLHFNDPRADRYLLHELEQSDATFLAGIVRLAANSRNPEVVCRLTELLNSRGNSEAELVLKGAIIGSLAEMASVQALPGLAAFIESRSLFTNKALLKLKLDAVASLGRYPGGAAGELANRLQQRATGEIASAAGKVSLQLRGAPS
jgi:hypothetical protein